MKHTRSEFIQRAVGVHGQAYTYHNVTYEKSSVPVTITCPIHGDFNQRPNDHLRGRGCPSCGGCKPLTSTDFVNRARLVHGDRYDYSSTEYKNMDSKVGIVCNVHGRFFQLAASHLNGNGCNKCSTEEAAAKTRHTTHQFINKAQLVHGDAYDYSKVLYTRAREKVEIVCPRHGSFWQIANDHIQGNKCPMCKGIISRKEQLWLTAMGVPNDPDHRQVLIQTLDGNFIVDGYCTESHTVYEFLGDYWHGNPMKYPTGVNPTNKTEYSVLYKNIISRLETLREMGYNVIHIWESNWSPTTHKEKQHVKVK